MNPVSGQQGNSQNVPNIRFGGISAGQIEGRTGGGTGQSMPPIMANAGGVIYIPPANVADHSLAGHTVTFPNGQVSQIPSEPFGVVVNDVWEGEELSNFEKNLSILFKSLFDSGDLKKETLRDLGYDKYIDVKIDQGGTSLIIHIELLEDSAFQFLITFGS
jgi:hypothetical protein